MKRAILLATTGLFMASAAMADDPQYDHTVFIVGVSIFPVINYVQPGDVVRVYNDTLWPRRVRAIDDTWESDLLWFRQSSYITVTEEMTKTFTVWRDPNADENEETSVTHYEEGEIDEDLYLFDGGASEGTISFEPDPRADSDDTLELISFD